MDLMFFFFFFFPCFLPLLSVIRMYQLISFFFLFFKCCSIETSPSITKIACANWPEHQAQDVNLCQTGHLSLTPILQSSQRARRRRLERRFWTV
ncbi:hypothetical protein GGR55DRAFT_218646 [Xylaria sp. FL0064]|nr:hypothetical protein GGR55DRAFT_218646 [Xylaria sp. FL0064]